jgi:glycosyltransferase involved in cell wall biosynthesis
LLAGSGRAEHRLRQHAHRYGVQEYVHMAPPIETVLPVVDAARAVFRDVDVYVQPFAMERWSPELLEAMSVGNAVVVVDTEANDLVVPGQTVRSLARSDARELSEVIVALLENPEEARQLAANAQGHLRRHFLASRMVSRVARAYRLVVSGSAPARGGTEEGV